jgi:hypothetical protein
MEQSVADIHVVITPNDAMGTLLLDESVGFVGWFWGEGGGGGIMGAFNRWGEGEGGG